MARCMGRATPVDLGPLYSLLRDSLEDLNVEGAAVMGEQLWLLQRGNGAQGANLIVELGLEEIMRSLVRDRTCCGPRAARGARVFAR